MSSYNNFISDFPQRCDGLLCHFLKPASRRNRDVTLMLAVATAGLVIPFERLRPPRATSQQHPARDRERFEEAARKLDELLDSEFLDSPLWNGPVGSWIFASTVQDEQQELDFWPELRNPTPLSRSRQVEPTLAHLRNALAHGNIFTRGDPIDLLVFLSRQKKNCANYAMLAVSPLDFFMFLQKWFSFLSALRMPAVVYEAVTGT